MADDAAHQADRVLRSGLPYRQYALAFPSDPARRRAFAAHLAAATIRGVLRVLFEHLRRCTGAPHAQPSAMVRVPRASDGGGLFFRLHILVSDGVLHPIPGTLDRRCQPQGPSRTTSSRPSSAASTTASSSSAAAAAAAGPGSCATPTRTPSRARTASSSSPSPTRAPPE